MPPEWLGVSGGFQSSIASLFQQPRDARDSKPLLVASSRTHLWCANLVAKPPIHRFMPFLSLFLSLSPVFLFVSLMKTEHVNRNNVHTSSTRPANSSRCQSQSHSRIHSHTESRKTSRLEWISIRKLIPNSVGLMKKISHTRCILNEITSPRLDLNRKLSFGDLTGSTLWWN